MDDDGNRGTMMDAAASREFDGARALVTGGASGIGRATAAELVRRGARVTVVDQRDVPPSAGVHGILADITRNDQVSAAVADAAARMGGIDVVANVAGVAAVGTISDNSDEEWFRVLDVNLLGLKRVSAAALPFLRRSAHPAIVNVSSAAARNGLADRALYSASKGAVLSLSLAMAADHVRDGVRVNVVCPGTVDTPWLAELIAGAVDPDAQTEVFRGRHPIGRLLSAAEVANAILYLASPRSGSTTGTVLDIDGGLTTLRVAPTDPSRW